MQPPGAGGHRVRRPGQQPATETGVIWRLYFRGWFDKIRYIIFELKSESLVKNSENKIAENILQDTAGQLEQGAE